MKRSRIRRLVGVIAAAALSLAALGIGPASAKTPSGWDINAVPLPAAVKADNDAGYFVTIKNIGPSNVNAVTASVVPLPDNASPTYFAGLTRNQGDPVTCTSTGPLVCTLGTLTPGTIITFTVAYKVPAAATGRFDVALRLRAGTGDVEGGNQSRGDAFERIVTTDITSNQNFDGGFVRPNAGGDTAYATTGTLGRGNKQTSEVVVTETGVTVNVKDGSLVDESTIECVNTPTFNCGHGTEWTTISVPGHDGYLKVTLFVWGGAVDGGVGASDFKVVHDPDSGSTYEITTKCDPPNAPPTAPAECLTATKVGSNWRIVVWLWNNGSLRGTW